MRPRHRLRTWLLWGLATVAATTVVLLLVAWWVLSHAEIFTPGDYGVRPPSEIFRLVFRKPIPDGVRDLVVAGHGLFQAQTIFIRFRADDKAMRQVLQSARPGSEEQFREWVPSSLRSSDPPPEASTFSGYILRDALKVRLGQALLLRDPAYYQIDQPADGEGFAAVIAVDRDDGVVYVVAGHI